MDALKNELIKLLFELKNSYAIGLKAEFGAEGATYEEMKLLKEISKAAGMELAIKIGGCEACRDIKDAYSLGANTIVAPMIESPYALEKYISTLNCVIESEQVRPIEVGINIETICTVKNINDIITSSSAKAFDTVVFGRSDMCASMGLSFDFVNSDRILDYAKTVANIAREYGKAFSIGGKIAPDSLDFLQKISPDKFETRKIVFSKEILMSKNAPCAIENALAFELLWIENKDTIIKTNQYSINY